MELRYRREAAVGLLIIVATAVFVLGMIWLRGKSLRSGELVDIVFTDVSGLKVGDPVRTSGVVVGQVKDIHLAAPGTVHVRVELTAGQAPRKDARATVRALDFFGAQYLDYEPGTAPAPLAAGQQVRGDKEPDITALAHGLSGRGQEVLANAAAFVGPENARELRELLSEARAAVGQLGTATQTGSEEAGAALLDLRKVLQRLDLLLGNDATTQTLQGMRDASRNLAQVTATLERTTVSLDSILTKINTGRGSIGRMVNDTTLVTDLHAASVALTELLTDLKANPSKYIHVRVF
jgi:phospholipid/cholesterol/gamma-HCH transport system substrate-binding protein